MNYLIIEKEEWDRFLVNLILSHTVFASVTDEFGQDYEMIRPENIQDISYNKPKPATPLKSFFLPVKENVTSGQSAGKPRIIIGVPNCDIEALKILDEFYLDKEFTDIYYKNRRENTILISSDCFGIQEHCHCLSYDIKPYSTDIADLAIAYLNGKIALRVITGKGEDFAKKLTAAAPDNNIASAIEKEHMATEALLNEANKGLPDSKTTGKLVMNAKEDVWKKRDY